MLRVPSTWRANFCRIEILFVGGVIRADDAELAAARLDLVELRPRFRAPCDHDIGSSPSPLRTSGDCSRSGMIEEIERVAAFDAQELAVDAGAVAIVAADDFVVAHAQRGLAAVGAVRADGADVLHFPRPRLIAIDAAGQRAHRADIDARAALVAFQMIALIGRDLGNHAAIDTPSAPTPMPSLQMRTQR